MSASSELHGKAAFFEHCLDLGTLVTLDQDVESLNGATDTTSVLEIFCQRLECLFVQSKAGNQCDRLAVSSLGLALQPDDAVARRRAACPATALLDRLAAAGAEIALVC